MKEHAVALLFLGVALILYAMAFAFPGTLFLVLAAVAEGFFWVRLFRLPERRSRRARGRDGEPGESSPTRRT